MYEETRTWRCPYCDGVNDWQNELCQVCGDGRRSMVVGDAASASGPEMPKAYTPRSREDEPPRVEPTSGPESPKPRVETPPAEPAKKKRPSLLWTIVIALLAYGGGKLLGQQMATGIYGAGNKVPAPTAVIVQTTAIPVLTEIPTRTPTQAPIQPPAIVTQAPAPTAVSASDQTGYWNFRNCSDAEIDAVMAQYWYGEDSARGVWCAMFMDREAKHGGLLSYDAAEANALRVTIGTFGEEGNDNETMFIIDADGVRHNLRMQLSENSPDVFRLVTADNRSIDLELSRGTSKKTMIRGAILKVVHGETAEQAESDAEDDFELKKGSRGEEVRKLQQALIKLGLLSGSADGDFGAKTEVAVRAFQTSFGFSPSGVVNRKQYKIILEEGGVG